MTSLPIFKPHTGSSLSHGYHTADPVDPFQTLCGITMGSMEQVHKVGMPGFEGGETMTFLGIWRFLACSRCYYLIHAGPPVWNESGKTAGDVYAIVE